MLLTVIIFAFAAAALAVMWVFIVLGTTYLRWKEVRNNAYYRYLNELRRQGKL